jgi:hypothetical protein
MKKGLIIFVLLLPIILVLWFYIHVNTHSQDIPPIDDSDLLWVQPVIPATNNAFHVFTNAAQVLCLSEKNDDDLYTYLWDEEASEESKKASRQEIASLIESNRLFFALVSEGLQRDHFFILEETNELAQSSMDLMKMNEVMLAKIKLLTEAGKVDEALDTAMLGLRLGELLERDGQRMIDALIGISIISRSLGFIEKIADLGTVSRDREEKLLKQLHQLKRLRTGLENGYKGYYTLLVNEVIGSMATIRYKTMTSHGARKFIRKDYVFKPNATKKVLVEYWRDQIDRLKYPEKKNRIPLDMSECRSPKGRLQTIRFALGENSLGKALLMMSSIAEESVAHETETAHKTEEEVLALEKKLLSRQRVNE